MTVKFQFNIPHNHVGACVCLERMKNVGEWTFWTIYYIKIVTTTKCFVHTEFNTKMTTHTATLQLLYCIPFVCFHVYISFVLLVVSFPSSFIVIWTLNGIIKKIVNRYRSRMCLIGSGKTKTQHYDINNLKCEISWIENGFSMWFVKKCDA